MRLPQFWGGYERDCVYHLASEGPCYQWRLLCQFAGAVTKSYQDDTRRKLTTKGLISSGPYSSGQVLVAVHDWFWTGRLDTLFSSFCSIWLSSVLQSWKLFGWEPVSQWQRRLGRSIAIGLQHQCKVRMDSKGTMVGKHKPHSVTFHESILVRLWNFQLT